jgi:hypothetical protein
MVDLDWIPPFTPTELQSTARLGSMMPDHGCAKLWDAFIAAKSIMNKMFLIVISTPKFKAT